MQARDIVGGDRPTPGGGKASVAQGQGERPQHGCATGQAKVISLRYGHQSLNASIRSKRARDGEREGSLTLEHVPQERAPGQSDAHLVNPSMQQGKCLRSIADQEDRVRQATLPGGPRRTSGRESQSVGIGIHADNQHFRTCAREMDHRCSVTSTQVEYDPPVATDQPIELADVDLAEFPSDDCTHGAHHSSGVE